MSRNRNKPPAPPAASDEPHDGFTPAPGFAGDDDSDEGADSDREDAEPEAAVTPPAPAEEDRVARMERELADLKALVAQSAAAGTVVPPGFKLVKDEPTQDAKSLAEQAAIRAELDKGAQRRTQEHCDRLFPEGKHVYRCVLAADRNGNPELLVRAANPTDAKARYLSACGINHTEHKVECARV